ncbi:MAG: DUF2173 family protein [Isosphaeraceae bacterium]
MSVDELVSRDGVLMAGRFGPDWRVAETRSKGLFVEFPPAHEVMGSFRAAIEAVFNALAVAMGGFSPSTWTPVNGWAASGGTDSIAVHGDRFVVVETDKIGSFDELRQLSQAGKPQLLLVPHLSIHAAGRGDPGPHRAFGNLALDIRHSGYGPATSGSGPSAGPWPDLVLCRGGRRWLDRVLMSKPAGGGGDMPSRGSSRCQVTDRDGPVCCRRLWRGASSAPARSAS